MLPMSAQSHIPAAHPLIGAHFSTAGGLHRALEEAASLDCQVAQLFTASPRQWQAHDPDDAAVAAFLETQRKTGVLAVSHAAYLINLAGGAETGPKSRAAFSAELRRCQALQIPYLVVHPGTAGDLSEAEAIRLIARSLDETLEVSGNTATTVLLETTAGQGRSVGHTFEQLAAMIAAASCAPRLGVCLDTCHIFAAGYDLRTAETYEQTIAAFKAALSLERLRFFHINDSKTDFNSHVDRHDHLGDGKLGVEAIGFILRDPRFAAVGKCLETEDDEKRASDIRILRRLQEQVKNTAGPEGRL